MRKNLLIIFTMFFAAINAQNPTVVLKPGDKAPGFVLKNQNLLQSFQMPYLNRILLLHFWNTETPKSREKNRSLNYLAGRYKNAIYKNADDFELIAICIQKDKKAWKEEIMKDSLINFTNSITDKDYNDDVCEKYGITTLPTDILIDENGIIIAINPGIPLIEEMLDEKKNFIPVRKDISGKIAYSSNKSEVLKFGKLYLFDMYDDSLSRTITSPSGDFSFNDMKLNQDYILKLDNKTDIITTDPLCIYNRRGDRVVDAVTRENGFVFHMPSNLNYKLTDDKSNESLNGAIKQVDVVKKLAFKNNGTSLSVKDQQDLQSIFTMLEKNKDLNITISTHTDSNRDDNSAMEITSHQANAIKEYLINKGVSESRINTIPKGKSEPRNICKECSEDDHKENRRVEFLVYKN